MQGLLRRSGIQAKLSISQPDDPFEREADHVADRIMRMHGGAPTSSGCSCSAGGDMCEECQQKQQPTVARKSEGALHADGAPPVVRDVLSRPGQPLPQSVRAPFEQKFGQDFSGVRVHDDSAAAESSSSINALAYTLGNHIVFGQGRYTPGTEHGDRLLAHELTHTIQQSSDTSSTQLARGVLQRAPCHPDAKCATGFPGDTGRYTERVEADQKAKEQASGPTPATGAPTCQAPRHKERAENIEKVVKSMGVTLPDEVFGFFINACEAAGGAAPHCRDFPGGAPTGSDPDKICVEVNASDEDKAKAILAKKTRTAEDTRTAVYLTGLALHEGEHGRFDAHLPAVPLAPAADCVLDTSIFVAPDGHDYKVKYYLSEMAAEWAEFAPYFQNAKTSPGNDSMRAMFDYERDMVLHPDENVLGIIKTLQCKCSCPTVDGLVEATFNDVTNSWTGPLQDQKDELQRAMTRMIPSYWPSTLKKV